MIINGSFSQPTFEYFYSSPLDEISRSLIEDEDGNIYFSVENFQYALIIKLNSIGEFEDSIVITNNQGTCNLAELVRIDTNYFAALGNWTIDTTSELWYVKFDRNLNIIKNVKINSNNDFIFEFHHIVNHHNNIVFAAHYTIQQSEPDVCVYEITKDGALIRKNFFSTSSSYNHAYAILEDIYDTTYKVFLKSPLSGRLPGFIEILDTNFNILETKYISTNSIETPISARWLNNSEYLMAGKKYLSSTGDWDIGLCITSQTDSILYSIYLGSPDTVEWPGLYKSLDFLSSENIFFAGSSNTYWYPFQNDPSWIMLNILDSNLNLKNQCYYGGDAFYLVNAILATQDSGCVLSCSRYDWLTQNNEFDIYILKVNKDGLLVSTPEFPVEEGDPCNIYPNPGFYAITIPCSEEGSLFQLFDSKGEVIRSVHLIQEQSTLSVTDLPCGLYSYRITNRHHQLICQGRWIKV